MKRFGQWPLHLMTIGYTAIWLWAAWSPVDRFGWFLENLLLILFLAVFILYTVIILSLTSLIFVFSFF